MARILVVDDVSVMRKKIGVMLVEAGHTVVAEAEDGEQAFREYEKCQPDIVLMDITMPVLDGIGAVKKIIHNYPKAKIIMVSALAQKRMVLMALQSGAMNYILKPVEYSKLVETIQRVMVENAQNAGTEKISKKAGYVPSADQPFFINNDKGVFTIMLCENICKLNLKDLPEAVYGLLFIKPLSVTFNFGELQTVDIEVTDTIAKLYDEIKNVKGKVEIVAKNDKLIENIKVKVERK